MKYEIPGLVNLNALHADCDPVCDSNGSAVLTCDHGISNQTGSCVEGTYNANINPSTQCLSNGGANAGYTCASGTNANNLCFSGGHDTLAP